PYGVGIGVTVSLSLTHGLMLPASL
ncbi:hypothetical protein CVH13_01805, partial [Dehalococcoides mccartyi]